MVEILGYYPRDLCEVSLLKEKGGDVYMDTKTLIFQQNPRVSYDLLLMQEKYEGKKSQETRYTFYEIREEKLA